MTDKSSATNPAPCAINAAASSDPVYAGMDGADVSARNKYGQTPLHFASTVEIAEFLLAHGAAIEQGCQRGLEEVPLLIHRAGTQEIAQIDATNPAPNPSAFSVAYSALRSRAVIAMVLAITAMMMITMTKLTALMATKIASLMETKPN